MIVVSHARHTLGRVIPMDVNLALIDIEFGQVHCTWWQKAMFTCAIVYIADERDLPLSHKVPGSAYDATCCRLATHRHYGTPLTLRFTHHSHYLARLFFLLTFSLSIAFYTSPSLMHLYEYRKPLLSHLFIYHQAYQCTHSWLFKRWLPRLWSTRKFFFFFHKTHSRNQ